MRSLRVAAAVLIIPVVAGCGGDDAPAEPETVAQTSTVAPAPEPETPAAPETHAGELAAGDETLESGEYADTYGLTVRSGQTVVLDATTDGELDPYVMLRSPAGVQRENDDFEGSRTHARLEEVAAESGYYSAIVTSFEPGESGSYTVTLTVRD